MYPWSLYYSITKRTKKNRSGRRPRKPRNVNRRSNIPTTSTLIQRSVPNVTRFVRTVSTLNGSIGAISMNSNSGWAAQAVNDLEFSFSLSQVIMYLGGVSWQTLTVPGYAEIANLYDFYRLEEVKVSFFFGSNYSSVTVAQQLPNLIIAEDYDDAAAISLGNILQYRNKKIITVGNLRNETGYNVVLRPKIALQVFNGITSGYAEGSPWINTTNTSVPYYGLKMYLDPVQALGSNAVLGYLQFYVDLVISGKDPL